MPFSDGITNVGSPNWIFDNFWQDNFICGAPKIGTLERVQNKLLFIYQLSIINYYEQIVHWTIHFNKSERLIMII